MSLLKNIVFNEDDDDDDDNDSAKKVFLVFIKVQFLAPKMSVYLRSNFMRKRFNEVVKVHHCGWLHLQMHKCVFLFMTLFLLLGY